MKQQQYVSPRIATYYFLTLFCITIPFWILGSVTHINGLPFDMQLNVLLVFAVPAVTCFFIYHYLGKRRLIDSLKACLPSRTRPILFVATLLIMPVTAVAASFITSLYTAFDGWAIPIYAAPAYFLIYYIGAAFEEIGWTWLATPALLRHFHILTTGLTIGIVWAAIHTLPWYQQSGLAFMIGMIVLTIINRIVMTMLYVYSYGQTWLIICYHAMINTVFTVLPIASPYANPLLFAVILASGLSGYYFVRRITHTLDASIL